MFRLPIVKFFSRILNRITITVVLVALQVAWVLWAFFSLTTGRVWVNVGLQLLSLFMMLYLVRKDENSAYKIGWIALMGVLPLLGGALYLSFGNKRPAKQLRSKLQAVDEAHRADLVQQPDQVAGLDASGLGMSRYLARYGRYPAWKNTAAQYFACGEAMYPQLLQDLERAEHTIFVEYFIVHTGKMWDGVEAILRRKAAQGVDVRLIYDDFGSLLGLPTDFVVRMERAHIRCIPFNPVVPVLSLVMNHRDHRKIVVIDGRIAYTGGVNLADEYINAEQRFGYWKDAALRIEGDAAWNFTVMFLNFWNAFRPSETDYSAFRPQHSAHPVQDGIVQPYADSPLDEEPVAETVYLNLLARAEQYDYANQHNPNNKAYKARVENDRNTKKVSSKHEAKRQAKQWAKFEEENGDRHAGVFCTKLIADRKAVIRRAIIQHDNLQLLIGLATNTFQTAGNTILRVIHRHDNADERVCHDRDLLLTIRFGSFASPKHVFVKKT